MSHPPLTALPEGFFSRWSTWYPAAPPVGFLLRAAHPERWLRIHSLPGAKRYPESPSDEAELLARHHALSSDVLGGQGAPCALLVWAPCEDGELDQLGARAAFGGGELPRVHRLPPEIEEEGGFAEPICLFGGACTWRSATFDGFILAVANDEVKGLVVELARGQVYAPYDGGADVFFATPARRDAARARYRHWLSPRPDGL